jgi:tetratricopeptide (TPR) repeat protein
VISKKGRVVACGFAFALAAALHAAGCSIASRAPEDPFPARGRRWERAHWDGVERALLFRKGALEGRSSESAGYDLRGGEGLIVAVPAGSALRVDARDSAAAAIARLRIEEVELAGVLGEPEEGTPPGILRADRPDAPFESGIAVAAARGDGVSLLMVFLDAPKEEEARVILERLRIEPIPARFEGLEERAKSWLRKEAALAGTEAIVASKLPLRPKKALLRRLATTLPWAAPAAPEGTPLRRAEEEVLLATYFEEVLLARAFEDRSFGFSFSQRERPARIDGDPPCVRVEGEPFLPYAEADRGRPLETVASGPAVLVIETRLVYRDPLDPSARRYAVSVFRRPEAAPGARFFQAAYLTFATAIDDVDGVRLDGAGRPVSRIRKAAVIVPPGAHRFRIVAGEPVLVRLAQRAKKGFWRDAASGCEDPGARIEAAREAAAEALAERRGSFRARFLLATADLLAGRAEEALERLCDLVKDPGDGSPGEARGVFFRLGQLEAALGRTSSALENLKRAEAGRTDPIAIEAAIASASLFDAQGEPARGAEELRRAIAMDPLDSDLWAALGRMLLEVPGAEAPEPAALAALDRALALDPGDPDILALRRAVRLRFCYLQPLAPARRLPAATAAGEAPPFPEETLVATVRPPPEGAPFEAPRSMLSPDERLLLPRDRDLVLAVPQPAVAAIEVRVPPPAAGEPVSATAVAVFADGARALEAALLDGETTLRLPLAAGRHRLRIEARAGVEAAISGAVAPADPAEPVFRRVRFDRLGGPVAALVYFPKEGEAPGFVEATVLLPGRGPRRAEVRISLDDGSLPRRLCLERAGVENPVPFRFLLPLPAGKVRLEATIEGADDARFALSLLRRRREPSPPRPIEVFSPRSGETKSAEEGRAEARENAPPAETDLVAAIAAASMRLETADDPAERARARLDRAAALFALDCPRFAAADFLAASTDAAAPRPLRLAALEGLSDACAAGGDLDLAASYAARAIAESPERADLRLRLGRLLMAANDPVGAAEAIGRIDLGDAEKTPSLPLRDEARLALAEASARSFDLAGARSLLSLVPGDPPRKNVLSGLVAFYEGRVDEALSAFDRAIAALPAREAALPWGGEIEASDDMLRPGAPPPGIEADLSALRALAARLAPFLRAARDPAALPAERARALLAIACADARWHLRARTSELAPLAEADCTAFGRERVRSRETGRSGFFFDAAGPGVLFRVEGPTLLRFEVRADHPRAISGTAALSIEPRSPLAPTARFDIAPDEPSTALFFVDRDDIVPGKGQIFDLAVPPGTHVLRASTGEFAAHVRAFALEPGFEDLLGGGPAQAGVRGALAAAAEALALIDGAPGASARDRLEALALLGRIAPEERPRLRAEIEAAPPELPIERATLLALAGAPAEAAAALESALARAPDPEGALFLVLLADSLGPESASDLLSRLPAILGSETAPGRRIGAKLARAFIALGKKAGDPSARWFARALLLLRDLRAADPNDAEVARLYEEAIERTSWVEVQGSAPAGFDRVLVAAEHVARRAEVLDAMLPGAHFGEGGALVAAERAAVFEVRLVAAADLLVEARGRDFLAGLGATEEGPLRLDVALDGERRGVLAPPRDGAPFRLLFAGVAPGFHRVEIALGSRGRGEAAKVRLFTSRPPIGSERPAMLFHEGRPFFSIVERTAVELRAASSDRPYRLRVRGPALLRLAFRATLSPGDSPREVAVRIEAAPPAPDGLPRRFVFRAAPAPGDVFRDTRARLPSTEGRLHVPLREDRLYEIALAPESATERVLVRAHARLDAPATETATAAPGPVVSRFAAGKKPRPPLENPPRPELDASRLSPPPALFGEEDGTIEAFARGTFFEGRGPEPTDRARNRYVEVGLAYRRRLDEAPLWLGLEASAKEPDTGAPVARFEGRALWRTPLLGLRLFGRAEGAAQRVRGEPEAAVDLEGRLDRLTPLVGGDLDLYLALGARAREQTLDRFPRRIARDAVAFDVFSPFYEHDDHWLYGRATVFWRPFFDLEAFAGASADTNRDFSPGDLDRASWTAGLRGFEGPLAWEASFRSLQRFTDGDRRHAQDERWAAAALDAVFPLGPSFALAPFAEGRLYFEHGEWSVGAGIRFVFGRGRAFRDFMPGAILFDESRDYFFPEPAEGERP